MVQQKKAPYTYLIRPSGEIRVCTRGNVGANETDTVFKSSTYFSPSKFVWDGEKMCELSAEQVAQRRQTLKQVQEAAKGMVGKDKARLRELLNVFGAKEEEAFRLVCKLAQIEL